MKISAYYIWYKKCENCGHDTGKASQTPLEGNARCWKCGRGIERDWSIRALKESKKIIEALKESQAYCNANDKSTEFMLEYMQDFAKVDLEHVLEFLQIKKPTKDKYFAIAGFANDMQYCDTLKEAQEFLESYFLEPKEGYHPDAETCFIYELKSKAHVFSEDGGKSFKHKFIKP